MMKEREVDELLEKCDEIINGLIPQIIDLFVTLNNKSDGGIKTFISQPMSGLTDEEVLNARNKFIDKLNKLSDKYDNKFKFNVIDNMQPFNEELENLPHPNLGYLSNDIRKLAECDVAFFLNDWKFHRGCRLEYECCEESNIYICLEELVDMMV